MGNRIRVSDSAEDIIHVLNQYIHDRQDRMIMIVYLTDRPKSLENLAEICGLGVSTVKRAIIRNAFIYKYLNIIDEN